MRSQKNPHLDGLWSRLAKCKILLSEIIQITNGPSSGCTSKLDWHPQFPFWPWENGKAGLVAEIPKYSPQPTAPLWSPAQKGLPFVCFTRQTSTQNKPLWMIWHFIKPQRWEKQKEELTGMGGERGKERRKIPKEKRQEDEAQKWWVGRWRHQGVDGTPAWAASGPMMESIYPPN